MAYFTENRAVKGNSAIQTTHAGATYFFASPANKQTFLRDPAKYVPLFGGYCAYGASKGVAAPIDPEAFQIVDERLILQYDHGVRENFSKNLPENLAKAHANWPSVVEKKGK